jgi:hypothetical protein
MDNASADGSMEPCNKTFFLLSSSHIMEVWNNASVELLLRPCLPCSCAPEVRLTEAFLLLKLQLYSVFWNTNERNAGDSLFY